MERPRFTVAIVGGGIAGLTLAIALGKHSDIEVHIYEGASKFGEIGAGVSFNPRAWDMFERLGIDHELLKYTNLKPSKEESPYSTNRKSDQPQGFTYRHTRTSGRALTFHRVDCQAALLAVAAASCHISLSKRLVSLTQDDSRIELSFQDGLTATCDVLIGADGYKSVARRCLLEERAKSAPAEAATEILSAAEPLFSGYIMYRSVISADKLRALHPSHSVFETANGPNVYAGVKAAMIAYPIQQEKLVNVGAIHPMLHLEDTIYDGPLASSAPPSEVSKLFVGWEPEVQSILKCLEHVTKWAIHNVKPMDTFVYRNVALIGDAAHAMPPWLAAGAGQAVEDAYILGTVLGHPNTTRQTLDRALHIYDTIRRPAALVARKNTIQSGLYNTLHMDGVNFENRTDPDELAADLHRLGEAHQALITATNSGTVDPYYREALRILEQPA